MPLHRHVFFVAGFDPKSPRYVHHLFRALAAHPAPRAEGAGVRVGPRRTLDAVADAWDLRQPQADGTVLNSQVTLLRWDDIVRNHWQRHWTGVLRDHVRFYAGAPRHGLLGVAWRESRLNWLFLMYPLGVALLVALGAAALAFAAGALLPPPWRAAGVAVAALALAAPAWAAFRAISHRVGSDWLMRLYGFSHEQAAGRIAALDRRTDEMAARIAAALQDAPPARELLVVGHSTGATLAACALARALAQARMAAGPASATAKAGLATAPTDPRAEDGRATASCGPSDGAAMPEVALLTLGHCTPLVYRFAQAGAVRDELARVSADARLTWVDYTAPADWAGCGRLPPWPRPGPALLKRLSPRLPKLLSPERYAALRRNRLAMHLQYLKPMDHAGRYDLLALLAGAPTLRERHHALPDDYPGSAAR